MEIQIPLVLFTSFLAWSIGIFSTQSVLALKKQGKEIQVPALICSLVVLVIGGISVVFHLTHPFSIFNGFGHITSGITQELIAIVVLVIVMVLYFLMMRRSEDGDVPQWLAIVALVVCVALVVAMGHSYMMASRPTWDNIVQMLSLLGGACVLGPATVAILAAQKKVDIAPIAKYNLIGAAINAVLSVVFMIYMQVACGSLQSFDYYYDPTHPLYALQSGATVGLFSGSATAYSVLVLVGIVVSLIGAFAIKNKKNQAAMGALVLVGGLVSVIFLRVLMYVMGVTMFMLY